MTGFELDHIGIAVNSLEEGKIFYESLGLKIGFKEEVKSEKVNVGFLKLENNCNIELLEATAEESPITKFIEKRGTGIHHICLRVKDINAVVQSLVKKGIQMINPEPKLGAHNCLVAFVHPKSTGGVLIELSEKIGGGGKHA